MITAILLSYKRKPNLPLIINALRSQTVPIEIWLINNNGFETFDADRTIFIPWNAGECVRYMFTRRVDTEWVMFHDDDILITDNDFALDAMSVHETRCPHAILGINGRGFSPTSPHYHPEIDHGYAHIIKGKFQLFKPESLSDVHIPWHSSSGDICFSLEAGRCNPVHWVDSDLESRIIDLPTFDTGYEIRPSHWSEREFVCKHYLKGVK